MDHFSVTVRKYGYTANEQTLGMTGEQLDEYFLTTRGRAPLEVTMKLQRYANGTWLDYAYPGYSGPTATFTTTDGYFAFPRGLGIGRYRIIETGPDSGYENIFDGTSLAGDDYYNAKAYYFQVTHEMCIRDSFNTGVVFFHQDMTVYLRVGFDPNEHLKMK